MHRVGAVPKKRLSKRHCQEDLACQHCCSCWTNFHKAYQVKHTNLEQENRKLKEQAAFLNKMNLELNSKLKKTRDVEKMLSELEGVKEGVREQLWEEVLEQKRVEDLVREEKVRELEEEKKRFERGAAERERESKERQKRIMELQDKLEKREAQLEEAEMSIESLSKQLSEKIEGIESREKKIESLESVLREKDSSFSKISTLYSDLEGKFMRERAKAGNLSFEKENLQRNLQYKEGYIDTLTKCSQDNIKHIGSLELGNKKLTNLVNNLDIKLAADRVNEEMLKDRLVDTEGKLYVAEEMARFNSGKVEAMKSDLFHLKMTL